MSIEPTSAIINPSTQLQVILKWVEGMAKADFAMLESVILDDFIQEAYPVNLRLPALTSKTAFIDHVKQILPVFSNFQMSLNCPKSMKSLIHLVIHANATADTSINFDYVNEYIIIFFIAEQGGKLVLTKVKEFIDSKFTAGFIEALQKTGRLGKI
ncbi:unnamed protein product [Somion occarium]|uniref:SnoaL-like domain-containing protein n=1 Tax=Somion occarium TaxID=3059160 RepID=A0ABP1DZZ4_9APHY